MLYFWLSRTDQGESSFIREVLFYEDCFSFIREVLFYEDCFSFIRDGFSFIDDELFLCLHLMKGCLLLDKSGGTGR